MVADSRYPVGPFTGPVEQTPQQRQASIATIAALPENLRSAVQGLSDAQLDTSYRDGGWTVRQVVHHVADSHINAYVRFRLLDARTLPVSVSLDLLEALHRRWTALFESLTEADWQRGYVHSENGKQKLAEVLQNYDWHSRHHVAHVTELRKRMGW
jgi:hypothetical protein